MKTDLNWHSINSHLGSQNLAFEQLCACLAGRDSVRRKNQDWVFQRQGRPDGGVECFWISNITGERHGYQAKFFLKTLGDLDSSEWKQCDSSFKQALKKFPDLHSFTFCFPRDLSDSPHEGKKTEREKWEAKRTEWQQEAEQALGRSFKVELWDSDRMIDLISSAENQHLFQFYFNKQILDNVQLQDHIHRQVKIAGARYQPDIHVSTHLDSILKWLVFDENHRDDLCVAARKSLIALDQLMKFESVITDNSIKTACDTLLESLNNSVQHLEFNSQIRLANCCQNILEHQRLLQSEIYSLRWEKESEDSSKSKERAEWYSIKKVLTHLEDSLEVLTQAAVFGFTDIVASGVAVVIGEGGSGKTHSLCTVSERATDQGKPAAIIFGSQLDGKDPWSGICKTLDGVSSRRELFDSLNISGEIAGCRSLLIIDAINESVNHSRWTDELRGLVHDVKRYPHVAVVISIRKAYAEFVIPQDEEFKKLTYYHYGFSEDVTKATDLYFDHYNIIAPDVPELHPEFENPLFLSIFCRSLAGEPDPNHSRKAKIFEYDHGAMDDVFDAFIENRQSDMIQKYNLDRDSTNGPLVDFVAEFSGMISERTDLALSREEAGVIAAKHIQSETLNKNILQYLESDGVLVINPFWGSNGKMEERVRFSFDRMNAHFVTKSWVQKYDSAEEAIEMFADNGFASLFFRSKNRDWSGSIAEALVLSWAKEFGISIFDSHPPLFQIAAWRNAYLSSLKFATRSLINSSLIGGLKKCLSEDADLQEVESLFRKTSCPSIIDELHDFMTAQSLADRDASWTVWLGEESWRDPGMSFVDWVLENQCNRMSVDEAVACATSLAWLTTSTTRRLRAKSIKAIAVCLQHGLSACIPLLQRFEDVNDPYVLQAVCLGVYGACLRSRDSDRIVLIAEFVLSNFQENNSWPIDVVARDALSGIMELAIMLCPESDLNAKWLPLRFSSQWIADRALSWDELEAISSPQVKQKRYEFDQILSSCSPEGGPRMYGDFGRYVVDSAISSFFKNWDERREGKPFESDLAHRYIVTRVLELGWSSELFGAFDRSLNHGNRHEHSYERIGKKYQWIALDEFLARATDFCPVLKSEYRHGKPVAYQHKSQLVHTAGIDPSLATTSDLSSTDQSIDRWWCSYRHESMIDGTSDHDWLLSKSGFPDVGEYLIQDDPDRLNPLALLGGYLSWKHKDPDELEMGEHKGRTIMVWIHGFAIKTSDVPKLKKWATDTEDVEHGLPHTPTFMGTCFGELYWHRTVEDSVFHDYGFLDHYRHEASDDRSGPPCETIPLSFSYSFGEDDDGLDGDGGRYIPSQWIMDSLCLRPGPTDFDFTNLDGTVLAFSTARSEEGSVASFCDLHALEQAAKKNDLVIVWCVSGEKVVLTGGYSNHLPLWPRCKAFYTLSNGKLTETKQWAMDSDRRKARDRKSSI